jgi:hypothetical protein
VKGVRSDQSRALLRSAKKQGWTFERQGNGHIKATDPKTGLWFTVSMTMSDSSSHSFRNVKVAARRAGLRV